MEFSDEYLTPQNDFYDKLFSEIKYIPTIYLFDFDNEHGRAMYSLIKNPLYPTLYKEVKINGIKVTSLSDFYDSLKTVETENDRYKVFCIPFSGEFSSDVKKSDEIINYLYILGKEDASIIITAGDNSNFNNAFPSCFIANKEISGGTELDGKDLQVTGTCAYAAFLSTLAIAGKQYLGNSLNSFN